MILYISFDTTKLNHTALCGQAMKLNPSLSLDSIHRMHKRVAPREKKDISSREHDDVIAKCVPVLGFRVAFREGGVCKDTKVHPNGLKTVTKRNLRYAFIYKKVKPKEQEKTTVALKEFTRQFRRFEDYELEVKLCQRVSDLK